MALEVLAAFVVLSLLGLVVLGTPVVPPLLVVLAMPTVPSVLVVLLVLLALLAVFVELVAGSPCESVSSSSSIDAAPFASSSMVASWATHPHLLAFLLSFARLPRFLLKMTSSLASALALADTNLPAMEEEAGVEAELLVDEADAAGTAGALHIWAGEVQARGGAAAGVAAEGEKENGHRRGDEGLGGAERMNSALRFCFELLVTLFRRVMLTSPAFPSRVPSTPCSLSLPPPPSQASPSPPSSSSSMKGISPSDSISWQLRRGVASRRGDAAPACCSGAPV